MKTTVNTTHVTEEMLSRATRMIDMNVVPAQVFYLVENSRGEVNDAGEVICYKVKFDRNHHIIRCLPHNGPACKASESGTTCQHMRIAVKAADEFKAEIKRRIQETEKTLREIEQDDCELALEAMYTVEVDPTSSSLDGQKWEVCPASGNRVPMR